MSENKFRSPPEHPAWMIARKTNKAFQYLFEVQNKDMNNPTFVLPYFTSRITKEKTPEDHALLFRNPSQLLKLIVSMKRSQFISATRIQK